MSRPDVESAGDALAITSKHHARLFRRKREALQHLAAVLERGGTLRDWRVHDAAEAHKSTDPNVLRRPKRKGGRRRAKRRPNETREEQVKRLARERKRRSRARQKEQSSK